MFARLPHWMIVIIIYVANQSRLVDAAVTLALLSINSPSRSLCVVYPSIRIGALISARRRRASGSQGDAEPSSAVYSN